MKERSYIINEDRFDKERKDLALNFLDLHPFSSKNSVCIQYHSPFMPLLKDADRGPAHILGAIPYIYELRLQ
jgi:hypothetical protein